VFENYAPLLDLRVRGQRIRTTAEHPFWVRGKGWVAAHELMACDHLLSHDGRWVVLDSVERDKEAAPVYNFRVAEYHTYFVGDLAWGFAVWSHNANYKLGSENAPNGIQTNSASGAAREAEELAALEAQYPTASVQRERYLRTAEGSRAIDPMTGEGRRIDFAVIEGSKVLDLVETTSETANKAAQIAKENRIREAGGTFIRDKISRALIDVTDIATRISRRM
jgi:hypothetical protein